MKKTLVTMLVVGLMAVVAQAATVAYTFDETASGTWDVSVLVVGADTAGLATYALRILNQTEGDVSYVEVVLGTLNGSFQPIGMQTPTSQQVSTFWNIGNSQQVVGRFIEGIGMTVVDEPGPLPGTTPHVLLAVPAVLGTLTTPAGLTAADFANGGSALLTAAAEGYIPEGGYTESIVVNPIPEPATMTLIGLGGLALIRRRRR